MNRRAMFSHRLVYIIHENFPTKEYHQGGRYLRRAAVAKKLKSAPVAARTDLLLCNTRAASRNVCLF